MRFLIINHGKILVDELPESLRTRFGNIKKLSFKLENESSEKMKRDLETQFADKSFETLKNGYFQITLEDIVDDMAKMLYFFRENNLLINDIKLEEASLEEVFIRLIEEARIPHE